MTRTFENEPWRALPPEAADAIEPALPDVTREILAAIAGEVPEYQRPLEGSFGRGVRIGVDEALRQFVALVRDPDAGREAGREVYVGLGRGELHQGRTLDSLLAAYRIGARVAWRRIAAAGRAGGLGPDVLSTLAEAVFAYIDELSALSAEGYAEEQSVVAGELQRRRRRLARLLLDSDPDEQAVGEAAADAGWEPPATVAALVWKRGGARLRPRLPADALVAEDEDADGGAAVLGDPAAPGMGAQIERAAAGTTAVLGPAVPLLDAAVSARRALALLGLLRTGAVPGSGLVRTEDHLAGLATHGDPGVLRDLADARLAPLEGETAASRARLTETLRAWLDHQGEVSRVAADLHVHPQTVRYRLGRLRELFGETLDEPSGRFELALALRSPGSDPTPTG